jgi:hypothetical protein
MSDSELGRAQDPADEETIAKAEEANRLAAEHGVADPGGLLAPWTPRASRRRVGRPPPMRARRAGRDRMIAPTT